MRRKSSQRTRVRAGFRGTDSKRLRIERLEERCLLSVDTMWFQRLSEQTPPIPETIVDIDWQGRTIPVVGNEWMLKINSATLGSLGENPVNELAGMFLPHGIHVIGGVGLEGYLFVNAFESDPIDVSARFEQTGMVDDFSPNMIYEAFATTPNDPAFGNMNMWGLHNTGQNVPGSGFGTSDADIDAPEAWDKQTGSSSVIVGVIDTGIDYSHPDLAFNIWTNPKEIAGNGIDDDGNLFVDDVHGWDFTTSLPATGFKGDNVAEDNHGHGTHVAGTIGAVGNNGIGVTGVAWKVSLLPLKIIDPGIASTTAMAASAISYATNLRLLGVTDLLVTNNSWGVNPKGTYDAVIDAAVQANEASGMLFVAAAGNHAMDTDLPANFITPAGLSHNNIISVAATDNQDNLATFPSVTSPGSNYGLTSVDLAAPGKGILSTWPGNQYVYDSGTSMAAPHVAGTAALIWSFDRTLTYQTVKQSILTTVDQKPSLAGKMVTGGRLNTAMAVMSVMGQQWISGTKYDDINGNRVQDQWEPGLAGWTIYHDANFNAQLDPTERRAVTNAEGKYWLLNLPPGVYVLREQLQPGWVATIRPPANITVTAGNPVTNAHWGNFELIDICGVKFRDDDGDGVRDPGEPGLGGWTIYIDNIPNGRLDPGEPSVTTMFDDPLTAEDEAGTYCFYDMGPDTYTIREVLQPGYMATLGGGGYVIEARSGVNPTVANCCSAKPIFSDLAYRSALPGQTSVITCYSEDPNMPVIGMFDLENLPNWFTAGYSQPAMYKTAAWNKSKLGDIFGLTLDDLGNIYVTATTIYGTDKGLGTAGWPGNNPPVFGPGGPGAVYKIDRRTGAVSIFAQLNNVLRGPADEETPSLGNITFDCETESFFVSNFEDGRIYQLNRAGQVTHTFDHASGAITNNGNAEVGDPSGIAPVGERVWAVQVHDHRLYYSVWWQNRNGGVEIPNPGPSNPHANEIYSIDISSGTFAGANPLEISVPQWPVAANPNHYSNPVSDMSFSPTGNLMLAERGMQSDWDSYPHEARALEYAGTTGSWSQTGNTFKVGLIGNNTTNSEGGVDYDYSVDGRVWVTADAAPFINPTVYGLQGLPTTGPIRDVTTSYIIDLDGDTSFASRDSKTDTGDVEVPCPAGLDFGNKFLPGLHGQKWVDLDDDGVRDANETGLNGWLIEVRNPTTLALIASQLTQDIDLDGNGGIDPFTERGLYSFNLTGGTYRIQEVVKPGWHRTAPPNPGTYTVTVPTGQHAVGLNFGNNPDTGSIHGFKYVDVNSNGQYDPAVDKKLAGIQFRLTGDVDGNGTIDTIIVQTDANGEFDFTDLVSGPYTVTELPSSSYLPPPNISIQFTVQPDREYTAFAHQGTLRPDQMRIVYGTELMFGNRALPGDYNHDGRVDAADYVLWRKNFGMPVDPGDPGDDDGDGDVDTGDYVSWTSNYGETIVGSGAGALAPVAAKIASASPQAATTLISPVAHALVPFRVVESDRPSALPDWSLQPPVLEAALDSNRRRPGVVAHALSRAIATGQYDESLLAWLTSTRRDEEERTEAFSSRPVWERANEVGDFSIDTLDRAFERVGARFDDDLT